MSKFKGYELWSGALNRAKYIVAPMVDQSELAWRMLSRKYGAELCYTPMLHAAVFRRDPNYRKDNLVVCPEDRPLIVQFCANDPAILLEAAKMVAPYCDAVDLNLGCPQIIAKKGHYGAFLQDEWDLISRMVGLLHRDLSVPVTCKIRVFEEVEKTVQYAKMLEKSGCQLLTVHGRTRDQRGMKMGLASWEHVRAVRESVSIPVFANGNIQYHGDVERCLTATGVDGVMAAEGNLFNPALFSGEQPPCWRVSEEYLQLVRTHPCPISFVRGHLFKIWFHVMKQPEFHCFRERMGVARSLETMEEITGEMKALLLARLSEEELKSEFTLDAIPYWRCQPYIRPIPPLSEAQSIAHKRSRSISGGEGEPDSAELAAMITKRQKNKRDALKKENKVGNPTTPNKKQWITCANCKGNPKGLKCVHNLCKVCCRIKCRTERLDCPGHRFTSKHQLTDAHEPNAKETELGTEQLHTVSSVSS
ncbi:tRNA-dihydrouridine(16/17) synthase [NAD(P)(+)]-like [Halichondria panicea]|uniref:tRNA-dihydrouridine(16/17) synthase [NAD(P)(+)]-like n=1 Tax=Halichondria panicea TaxID=6063 RepID=UPI00312BC932